MFVLFVAHQLRAVRWQCPPPRTEPPGTRTNIYRFDWFKILKRVFIGRKEKHPTSPTLIGREEKHPTSPTLNAHHFSSFPVGSPVVPCHKSCHVAVYTATRVHQYTPATAVNLVAASSYLPFLNGNSRFKSVESVVCPKWPLKPKKSSVHKNKYLKPRNSV